MEMDFHGHLWSLDELDADSVEVTRFEASELLIRATCRTSPGVGLTAALEAVERVWLQSLRYTFFEAHDSDIDGSEATLQFVTQSGPNEIYVTGRVRIKS
jgi:hypothetical protein